MPKNENQVFHCNQVETDTISVRTGETDETCALWFDVNSKHGPRSGGQRITVTLSDADAVSITLQMVDILRDKGLWVAAGNETMVRKLIETMLRPTFDVGWRSGAAGAVLTMRKLIAEGQTYADAMRAVAEAVGS
jgi:hypothetical protein